MSWPELAASRAALAAFDEGDEEHYAVLRACSTDDEVAAWVECDNAIRRAVARAYWHDTQDRNSRSIIDCMGVGDVRNMVRRAD